MIRPLAVTLALVCLGVCQPHLSAQVNPFQLLVQDQNQNITPIVNGAGVTINTTGVGHAVSITLVVTYTGVTSATLAQPQLTGPGSFTVGPLSAIQLATGQSASAQITYTAATAAQASAVVSISYLQAPTVVNGATSSGTLTAYLTGTAPSFTVAYAFASNQNVNTLTSGGTLTFPPTPVQTTSAATIVITNIGSGGGLINSVQVSGSGFSDSSVPLLPGTLPSNGTLQFPVQFTPQQTGTSSGTLQIGLVTGTFSVNLAGTGVLSNFNYSTSIIGQSSTISPGATIALPNIPAGSSLPFTVTVQNNSSAAVTIPSVVLAGVAFQGSGLPSFPQTLAPGASDVLTFLFAPPQAGTFSGSLRIGADTFLLTGATSGSQLSYSYSSASGTSAVSSGGTVFFSQVQVGQSTTVTFTVTNTGTTSANLSSIYIPTAKSAFQLSGLPAGPISIAPGSSVPFTITFQPVSSGTNTAVLQIDSQSFTLSGAGTAPPSLPSYQFQATGGTIAPMSQPSIGVTLSKSYPVALTGTLSIVQTPQGFANDPSVQFSTGGNTVAFSIPAGQTQAVFANGATTVKIQSGTIAGSITIVPTFTTAGGDSVTPPNPATLQFIVPASAPTLLSVQVTQNSQSGFTLQVVGLSTSRSLNAVSFAFSAAPSYNLANATVAVNMQGIASTWFASAASTQFGGQFTLTIPFSLVASQTSITNPLSAIQSVSITATNSQGTSNAVTTPIP